MFYYVSGTVAHVEPYLAVIDCGGVGYACKTTSTTISQLQVGKASKLYTYLHVGEGIFDLYGFATQGELGSFKQLIGVSGELLQTADLGVWRGAEGGARDTFGLHAAGACNGRHHGR